jgi:hypothetical protein
MVFGPEVSRPVRRSRVGRGARDLLLVVSVPMLSLTLPLPIAFIQGFPELSRIATQEVTCFVSIDFPREIDR